MQCASSDLTVDPVSGHLLLRDTTPSGVTFNVEIGSSDANPSPGAGRKLLAGQDSQPAGRSLLQTPSPTAQPVLAMNTICEWHSPDFWNSVTGTYLTGTCSQFQVRSRHAGHWTCITHPLADIFLSCSTPGS